MTTLLVSVSSSEEQGHGSSFGSTLSADGSLVAFTSAAGDLVPGDTNGVTDVFVRNRDAGTTLRVSVSSAGAEGDGPSFAAAISADGRVVAFDSYAANLVAGDTNLSSDVFVHDLAAGTTTLMSASISGDVGNGNSFEPSISADGRFVAFTSGADDLVPGDTNSMGDVFVRDLVKDTTVRVSEPPEGQEQGNDPSAQPAISGTGRFVAFWSAAQNLVPNDTNLRPDIFVRDLGTGSIVRASVSSAGVQANDESTRPAISSDGRRVAFESIATNLVAGDTNFTTDVFVRILMNGRTVRASIASNEAQANSLTEFPSISADGTAVAFTSYASNLVAGDTNECEFGGFNYLDGHCPDVFVRHLGLGATRRISLSASGAQANDASFDPFMHGPTRLSFSSEAINLVAGDANASMDVFLREGS